MSGPVEYELGDGTTVIIEWSPTWKQYAGTVQTNGARNGTILRDTIEEVLEVARERRD